MFSGLGGFDSALRNQGHTIVGACEIDKYARNIYKRQFPKIPVWEDATKIKPEELPDFDMLCAGFPCQDVSIAGKRKGFGGTNTILFFEITRIASQKRPRHLLLENVKGLLSHKNGGTARKIFCSLDELGYDTQSCTLNTSDFLPQNRERVFIVATLRKSRGRAREIFPVRKHDKLSPEKKNGRQKREKMIRGGICPTIYVSSGRNCGEACIMTPAPTADANGGGLHSDMMIIIQDTHQPNRVYDPKGISQTISANGGGWGAKTGLYAVPVLAPDREEEEEKKQNRSRSKEDDDHFYTSAARDRHGILHGKRIRRLTPKECERLQGFPDGFSELGADGKAISDTQRYKSLGNAVTVPVAEHVIRKIAAQ